MAQEFESVILPATGPITVSTRAAGQIAYLLKDENNQTQVLRVSVSGGGCSGFQYGFTFDDQANDDDIVIKKEDITVVIDLVSAGYMAGSEIDYVEDLIGTSFQVKNPQAVSSCGCGTSFSIG